MKVCITDDRHERESSQHKPSRPKQFYFFVRNADMRVFVSNVLFPEFPESLVGGETWHVVVKRDSHTGEVIVNQSFPATDPTGTIRTPKDQPAIHVHLSAVDPAGNESEPRMRDFVLTDIFAPPMPGEFGVQVIGEEDAP